MKKQSKEIYESLVADFSAQLRAGKNPFADLREPLNGNTKAAYRGFNRFYLATMIKEKGFTSNTFLTFKQAKQQGAMVKKGSKGFSVFFWGTLYAWNDGSSSSGDSLQAALKQAKKKNPYLNPSDLQRKVMFMKHFTAFNLDQIEGIEIDLDIEVMNAQALIYDSGAELEVSGGLPSYDEALDVVYVPKVIDEKTTALIYPSLIEWTGSKGRLDRSGLEYAEESLVDLMGSSFLCQSVGIDNVSYDPSLIERWLEVLDKNPMVLYGAASKAQKAYDLIFENVRSASSHAA